MPDPLSPERRAKIQGCTAGELRGWCWQVFTLKCQGPAVGEREALLDRAKALGLGSLVKWISARPWKGPCG